MTRWVFSLNYKHPHQFIENQWGLKPYVYIIYRWTVCIYVVAWLVASVAEFTPPKPKYLLNITSWSLLLLTLTVLLRAVLTTKYTQRVPVNRMTFSLKLVWVLENVSSVMALGVTIGYWSVLNKDGRLPITAVTVHSHGVNGLYAVVDLFLTSKPYRLLHFWHSVMFSTIYLTFSAIYWAAGGTGPTDEPFIYPSLDWRRPSKTLVFAFLFGVVLTMFTHAILFILYKLRMRLHKRYIIMRCDSIKEVPEEEKELQDIYLA